MTALYRERFRRYKVEIFLFTLAFAAQTVIFVVTFLFGSGGFLWSSDAESYFALTQNLVAHNGFFVDFAWGPSAFRTPLYPLFAAGLYALVPKLAFVIFIQNILGAVSVVLAYRLGRVFFSHRVALLAALLFLFESQRLQVTNQLMSETLFLVFFLPSLLFFFKYRVTGRTGALAASAIFLGLATLTRPIVQHLALLMIIFIFFAPPARQHWRRSAAAAGLFFLLFYATLAPWIIRNGVQFGAWKVSPLGGVNLYYANARNFLTYKKKEIDLTEKALRDLNLNLDRSDWVRQSIRLMEFKYEPYFTRAALSIIFADPAAYASVHARRAVAFFIDSSLSRSLGALTAKMQNRPEWIFYPYVYWGGRFVWLTFLLVIAAGCAAFWKTIKKKLWLYSFVAAAAAYFAALAAMNRDAPRMRLPVNVLIFLLFAECVFLFGSFIKRKCAPMRDDTHN